ncbi:hypothetical protein RHSIM_RhsimUnG0010900 [Rhododendron simsii]|uniref:Uncharacterized protein n=1 Tax=Rhododendron simsii TaxID=118357 RepID=A0A834FXC6_RHOSS|nr:hypothetical protein RHSIM_RhsimUnG0010900 [Rhododendron simsii]
MENSNPIIASTDTEPQEESGWTSYFEDFLATQRSREDQHSTAPFSDQESFCSPSLVSDAASCAPSKTENRNQVPSCDPVTEDGPPVTTMHKTASFKKVARTEEISRDDSLEDTASSPANSPKVSSLKEMDIINPRKREDNNGVEISNSLGKGGGSDCCTELIPTEGGTDMTIEGYTELNRRGLCLVPLSIVLNYLG